MDNSMDREDYKEYKDKRFTLSDDALALLVSGVNFNLYYVAEKINNFVVAGIKSYSYDTVTKKLVGGKDILTTGLN
jgi:hypothetical protein